MNYKKLIKSRDTRVKILKLLNFLPDTLMVRIQYYIKMGHRLNLRNPQKYTEKLQWMKLYYRNSLMSYCSDKYDVRVYVEKKGYADILNEIYGVFSDPDDIDFTKLPNSFVIKDTLGSGGNSVILIEDKNSVNQDDLKTIMKSWVHEPADQKNVGREWVYDGRKHRIIIEKLLSGDKYTGDLPDYKFFCFNGEVKYVYFMMNYTKHHELGILGFLTPDFKLTGAHRKDFAPLTSQPEKPKNYEKMLAIAKDLSEGFPHVRVDFYNIEGEIVFGEMTFFTGSGYMQFEPDEFDYTLGESFILPTE